MSYFSEKIKILRAKNGYTQKQVADLLGLDRSTYSYYEFDGVRVIPKRYAYYDSVDVPTKRLSDGTSLASHEGFLVPLGVTNGGDRQIELVQLRKPTMGSINGINKGGEGMATSIDGTSVHFLFQTGVICRTKVTRIFRDYNS